MRKLILLVLCLMMIVNLIGCSKELTMKDKKILAWSASQTVIKSKLKSPSTAKFQSYKVDGVKHIKDDIFKVVSYVDAQNSFGAIIRSNYEVTVDIDFKDDSFKVLDLQIK